MTDGVKVPVRVRVRQLPHGNPTDVPVPRLVVDGDDKPRRKRAPNSGSMKKGETRNPHGRPKGAKGFKTLVRKVLGETTAIRTAKGTKKVSIFHALLMKELELATKGDWRARKTILELGRLALPEESPDAVREADQPPGAADEAILDWFEGEVRERDRQASAPKPKKARRNSGADDGEEL